MKCFHSKSLQSLAIFHCCAIVLITRQSSDQLRLFYQPRHLSMFRFQLLRKEKCSFLQETGNFATPLTFSVAACLFLLALDTEDQQVSQSARKLNCSSLFSYVYSYTSLRFGQKNEKTKQTFQSFPYFPSFTSSM